MQIQNILPFDWYRSIYYHFKGRIQNIENCHINSVLFMTTSLFLFKSETFFNKTALINKQDICFWYLKGFHIIYQFQFNFQCHDLISFQIHVSFWTNVTQEWIPSTVAILQTDVLILLTIRIRYLTVSLKYLFFQHYATLEDHVIMCMHMQFL